jgi:hypothetical protein
MGGIRLHPVTWVLLWGAGAALAANMIAVVGTLRAASALGDYSSYRDFSQDSVVAALLNLVVAVSYPLANAAIVEFLSRILREVRLSNGAVPAEPVTWTSSTPTRPPDRPTADA